jgi:CDP-4-dehydro-6-deoxyglucose reductase
MALIKLSSGKSFQAPEGLSILDASSRAGIALPYSCKTGRCSTCKCKVLVGTTEALSLETGLTEQENAEGWILSCVRTAVTDLVLEVDDLEGVKLPLPKTWPCRIKEIIRLAPDVIKVYLRLPPSTDFQFISGQYIEVIGYAGIRRSYSLANSNFSNQILELHIRAVEGGAMSEYWFKQAKPNDLLRFNGPLGTFFVRDPDELDLIFLATGTGIAPVKSMLETLVERHSHQRPNSITLLWGGRYLQDFYMNVNEIPGDFSFFPVLSRPTDDWTGYTGYVQDVLVDIKPDLTKAVVYACGSDAMIQSAKISLVKAGLPAKCFYSDAFVNSGPN